MTLVILAAGMGSRYGGLKQIEPVSGTDEIILDFSLFDAKRAGFESAVIIIKRESEDDFRRLIENKAGKYMNIEFAYQDISDIPDGFSVPEGRSKPWGTGQAVLAAKELIDGPFCVINADDYYGKEAFVQVHDYLVGDNTAYCMAGFILKNTLSENGGVTRGVCQVKGDVLVDVIETSNIVKTATGAEADGKAIDPESYVSMNFWGFMPNIFGLIESMFVDFLKKNNSNPKSEFFIPLIVTHLIQSNAATVEVLESDAEWFGVTYQEDRPFVVEKLKSLNY